MNSNQTSIEFSSAKYSGLEKDQPFPNQIEVTVTRSGNTDNYDSVELHLGNTTAQEGFDFGGLFPQWIDFQPGETEKKVYIDIHDDFDLEGTENIELKLIGDLAILGQKNTTSVSILDNETTYLEFESAKYITFEEDDTYLNQLEITVTCSGNLDYSTMAEVRVVNGTAEEGNDFYVGDIWANFEPGQTSTTIFIEVPNDWNFEGTESFQLQLWDDPHIQDDIELGENATTTIEIRDKQTSYFEFSDAKYITYEEDDAYFKKLEVTVNRSGNIETANEAYFEIIEGSADYSDFYLYDQWVYFDHGETSKVIEIEVPNDWNFEGTESFQLQLWDDPHIQDDIELGENATTTIEIRDKQTSYFEFSDAKYITYEEDDAYFKKLEVTVNRSGNIETANEAYFEIIEGSADYSDFYLYDQWVYFDHGETSKVIEIEVPNDWNFEGTESFQLQLWDDPYIQDDIELGENATTTIEIRDKQTSYFEFSDAKYITYEEDDAYFKKLEVTVNRSGNIETANEAYFEIIEGSADYSDFYLYDQWVYFDHGETSKVIEIEVPNDWNFEGTESFQLQLWDDPYIQDDIELGENATTTIEIRDKQTSYFEFSDAKYITYEEDDAYFKKLEVTVNRSGNIETANEAYFEIIEGSADYSDFYLYDQWVYFDHGETSKVIEIEVPNDWNFEGTESFQLQLWDDPHIQDDIELGENATTTIEIRDKQTSYFEFSDAKYITYEEDDAYFKKLEVTVNRSGNIETANEAYFEIIEGSADYSDFYLYDQWVYFDHGETSKVIEIEVPNDWNFEGTESFQLQLWDDPHIQDDIELGENATTTIEIRDKQTSYFEFSDAKYITYEEDDAYFKKLEVTVNRSGNIETANEAYFEIIEGSADYSDFYLYDQWVYFDHGETSKVIEIEVPNDWNFEGTESFQLQLWDDPYIQDDIELGENATTTIEIRDKQTSYFEFSDAKYITYEEDDAYFKKLEVTVNRSGNIETANEAYFEIIEGSADYSDFYLYDQWVYFDHGETSKVIEIEVPNDWNFEGTESFQLQLWDDPYIQDDIELGENATTTIEIRDKQTSYFEFSDAKYITYEEDDAYFKKLEVTVNRSGNIETANEAYFEIIEGSADYSDFYLYDQWVYFDHGETSKVIEIEVPNDWNFEGTESFQLQLWDDPYIQDDIELGENATTTIEIRDKQTSYFEFSDAKYITYEEDDAYFKKLEVTVNRSGNIETANEAYFEIIEGSADYSDFYLYDQWVYFNHGETSKVIEIEVPNDWNFEGTESFQLQLWDDPHIQDDIELGENATTTIEIRDKQTSYFEFSDAKYITYEEDDAYFKKLEVTVNRSGNIETANEAYFEIIEGSADYSDFYLYDQWVYFDHGETSKVIEIEVPNDWNFEGTESFQLQLWDDPYIQDDIELGENATTTIEIRDKQTSYFEFSDAKYITYEEDDAYFKKLEVTVNRSGNIETANEAYFEIIEGSADYSDFYLYDQWVYFNHGETSKVIEIEVPNDWNFEGTESFQLQLWDDPYIQDDIELGENATTTIEIRDKQTSYFEFSDAKYITYEEDDAYFKKLEVTVNRSGNIETANEAYFEIIEGSADYSDFYLYDQWVYFNHGETSKVIEIEVPNDWNFEGTESFQLQLWDDPHIQDDIELGENATTTIEIRDKQTSYFEFSDAKYITYEEDDAYFKKLEVTVNRSGNIETANEAYFEIIEGSADYSDFYLYDQWVYFDHGESSKVIEIEVPNDWNFEGTESFQLQLWDDPYIQDDIELGENATTTIEIRDKQTSYFEFSDAKYITYEEDDAYFKKLEVTVNRSGNIETANEAYFEIIEGSADYSDFYLYDQWVYFDHGETSKVIEIEVPNDWNFEGTESFQLQLWDDPHIQDDIELGENATTTIEIRDKQTSYFEFGEAKYVTFENNGTTSNQVEVTVSRFGNIDSFLDVEVQLVNSSAQPGLDFDCPSSSSTWLTFDAGESSKTITIDIFDDTEIEGTETFNLQLIQDPYTSDFVIGEQDTTIISIFDDDTSLVEFSQVNYSILEDDPNNPTNQLELFLTRTRPLNDDVKLELYQVGGSAKINSDFKIPFDQIEFAPGESNKTVYLDILSDFLTEGTETIELGLRPSPYGNGINNVGEQNTTTVNLFDNETTYVEFGSVSYTVNEDQEMSMVVEIIRSGDTSFESWVHLDAVGGTATWEDYGLNNLIHFTQGETSEFVEVFLNNDLEIEETETIDLQILSGEGNNNYVVGTQDTTTVEIIDNDVVIAEIGEITHLNHESQTIVLDHNFINPVIFSQPLSYNGADPSTIRITDIQSNSFSVQLQETTLINGNSHSGYHTTESFSFLVVEQGIWELYDGSIIQVGNVTTNEITTSNWETINFNNTFDNTPVVLTQVQTDNDATFVRTRQRNATNNGFEVALEEEEAFKSSGHGSETIAWLAISPGQGSWDGNQFIAGNTGDQVTQDWHTIDFGNSFTNTPNFLGNIATFDGGDPSGLRYQNLTNGNVQIKVEEDTSQDTEINHTTENINFLVIEADGNLIGSMDSLTGLVTQETGTINADSFALGNASESFYDNYGQQDYAEISDFDVSQDIIQLHGIADDYYLGSSPSGNNDQIIFLKVAGMEDELVGIVKNTNTLDINSENFAFV